MTQPQAQTAGASAEGGGQSAPPTGGEGGGRAIPKVSGERVAQLGPLIALLLACIFCTTQSDRFLDPANYCGLSGEMVDRVLALQGQGKA